MTPPESDTQIAGHLDATYVGRVIEITDEGMFSSLVGPIASITHTDSAVLISVGVPLAEIPEGEDAPLIPLRLAHDARVLIRRESPNRP